VAEGARGKMGRKRIWWMLVVLLILANFTLWRRPMIAHWLGTRALKSASDDDAAAAARFIRWSRVVWRQSPEAALASARLARRANDLDDFALQLKRAQYLGIDEERSNREYYLAMAQSGQMRLVGEKLNQLIDTAGGDEPQICEAYALGYMKQRDFRSALTLLEAWTKDFAADARPQALMGLIYAELQSNEQAEKAYRAALQLDPQNVRAALGLGNLLLELKRPEEAIPYLRLAVPDSQMAAEAAVGLASALQSLSGNEEAMTVLRSALEKQPQDDALQGALADALNKQGKYVEAERLLADDIKAGTKRRELRYFYAIALRGLGRIDEATEHFAYAAEANQVISDANRRIPEVGQRPGDVELRYGIGAAHLQYGNIEDGLSWLNSALEIDPQHLPSHRALAEFYSSQSANDAKNIPLAQRHAAFLSGRDAP
jgi:Tfp pilus assembly protein PilF